MKTTIIFSLLLFICLIQGCVSPNSFPLKGEKKLVLNNSERVLSVTSLSSYQPILLETNDNSLIKDINRMYCYEDTLFVFDRFMKKITLFNKHDGTYINTISHVGQGPGEYVKAMDFCIDSQNKRIIITCDIPYKLLFYSFSGDLQKEVSLPLYYSEIVTNGIIHSNQFKRMIDVYLEYQGKTENIDSKLWELYESMTDESNPILIICKI